MKYTSVGKANKFGYAKVSLRKDDIYYEGVVDSAGLEIIPLQSSLLVNDLTDTIALIQYARGFVFADLRTMTGDSAALEKLQLYQFAYPYSCGLALVQMDDLYYYINEKAEPCFDSKFDFAESFIANRAFISTGKKKWIIDNEGNIIYDIIYDQVSPYNDSLWQVTRVKGESYKSGFMNRDGKLVIPLKYDQVGYYDSEFNRTRVRIKDKLGFVDENGEVAIPLVYDYAEVFYKKLARVRLDGRYFFIDVDGKETKEQ